MTRTAHASEKMKRECLIRAAVRQGTPILCAICGQPIMPEHRMAFDHGHAIGRGGPNVVGNLFPVHDEKTGEFDCHTRKSAHPRGAHTAICGDTFEAAKTVRLEAMTKLDHAVRHGLAGRPPSRLRGQSAILSRRDPWPAKGTRKLHSRSNFNTQKGKTP